MKLYKYLFIFLLWPCLSQAQPADSATTIAADSGLLAADSLALQVQNSYTPTIIDTLKNDSFFQANFRRYAFINNQIVISANQVQREVPSMKEIQLRNRKNQGWIFWIILAILFHIAAVRTFNQKNFKASLNAVFSMKITEKLWQEKGVIFNFITIQLFAIFVLISSLFIYVLAIYYSKAPPGNHIWNYLVLTASVFGIYLLKFGAHYLFGSLMQLNKFGLSMVSNTITINNFIAMVIFPFIIMLIYTNNSLVESIFIKTIFATFILSVLYRVVRSVILHGSYFRYPLIYLILYLCTFEISPWLIIVDLVTD